MGVTWAARSPLHAGTLHCSARRVVNAASRTACRHLFLRRAAHSQAYQDMLIAHKLGPSIAGIENRVARARDLVQRWADWKDHYQVAV